MVVDNSAIGPVLSFLGLLVTALSGVWIATKTNRSEKKSAAQAALEAKEQKLQEKQEEIDANRFKLKDEEIDFWKTRFYECRADLEGRGEEAE